MFGGGGGGERGVVVVFLAKLNISPKNNNLVFLQLQNPSLVAGFVVPVNLGLQLGENVHFEAKKRKRKKEVRGGREGYMQVQLLNCFDYNHLPFCLELYVGSPRSRNRPERLHTLSNQARPDITVLVDWA